MYNKNRNEWKKIFTFEACEIKSINIFKNSINSEKPEETRIKRKNSQIQQNSTEKETAPKKAHCDTLLYEEVRNINETGVKKDNSPENERQEDRNFDPKNYSQVAKTIFPKYAMDRYEKRFWKISIKNCRL